jgi:hypothetical protein
MRRGVFFSLKSETEEKQGKNGEEKDAISIGIFFSIIFACKCELGTYSVYPTPFENR